MFKYLLVAVLILTAPAFADEPPSEVPASPKAPWGEIQVVKPKPSFSFTNVLLWVPNRLMDLFDIFRFDVGLGPSHGGVIRLTKYAQIGYRDMTPASLRIGDFGREAPYLSESSPEYGVSPFYVESTERKVCPGEVGLGLDLFVTGAYVGICFDEAGDFLAGLLFFDPKHDDLR